MSITYRESGLIFGEYEEDNIFRIEDSKAQRKAGTGVKTVEFVLLSKRKKILFVEAKTTCPNCNALPANKENYEKFFSEITEKFEDSVNLFASSLMERLEGKSEIGKSLSAAAFEGKKYELVLVLVVAKADILWLPAIQAELVSRLKKLQRIWKCNVAVLNEKIARDRGLLCDED